MILSYPKDFPVPRWIFSILSLEIRKIISYRIDFWVSFLGTLLAHLGIAYFLWKAVFDYQQVTQLGGYSFHAMMFYYLLVPLVNKTIRAQEMGFISQDIYEGSLNRYLIYPISFFAYKYISHLSYSLLSLLQLSISILVFFLLFGLPPDIQFSLGNFVLGVIATMLATALFFAFAAILELIAFWADNVWSLLVMLRFVISLLGGAFIPLSLFPSAFQKVLSFLPFSYLVSFPIQTFLGRVSFSEWLWGLVGILAWFCVFSSVAFGLWRRGLRQYSGIGI